jgi:hypothetical protein
LRTFPGPIHAPPCNAPSLPAWTLSWASVAFALSHYERQYLRGISSILCFVSRILKQLKDVIRREGNGENNGYKPENLPWLQGCNKVQLKELRTMR